MPDSITDAAYWDARTIQVRPRPPSRLNVAVRDLTRLLGRHINPGDRVVEAGCAPGKFLLWCAAQGAHVSGIEYAPKSHEATRDLFARAGHPADLRCEDLLETTFGSQFDLAFSIGLIEHFRGDTLRQMVRKHVELVKPGKTAVIIIPNFQGFYGPIFRWADQEGYDAHNIELMSVEALRETVPEDLSASVKVYRYGMLTPWITSRGREGLVHKLVLWAANCVGLVQPFRVGPLCPWLVLEIVRV